MPADNATMPEDMGAAGNATTNGTDVLPPKPGSNVTAEEAPRGNATIAAPAPAPAPAPARSAAASAAAGVATLAAAALAVLLL
jgi:hypothetical protein